jgi:hypothetical protein
VPTINIFEGSRRIALLLKVAWMICVAVVFYVESTTARNAFWFAIGGWTVLSVLQAAIGWIVRGFIGVPRGHDHEPAHGSQSSDISESL